MFLGGILSFLGLCILLVVSYPNLIIAEKISHSRQPEMGEVKITRAILQITNRCPQPHYFRVTSDIKDANFKRQTDAILIRANATEKVEVLSDTMAPQGKHKAAVECLDCKKEDGCTQDRYEVPIEMASVKIAPKGKMPDSPRSASVLARQNQLTDVGIIPETSGGCPIGSEFVIISMDDSDSGNTSSVSGWTGDISHYSTGTTFGFCRVDGNQFYSLPTRDYAVLQLGSTCPNGSQNVIRVFDNQHGFNNNNWSSGNISPNSQSIPHETSMSFCFFPKGVAPTTSSFPNFYVPYGVFAAPPSLMGLATGVVHTDDNDSSNADRTCTSSCCSTNCSLPSYVNDFANIVYGTENGTPLFGKNTNLLVTKVANGGPCTQPGPALIQSTFGTQGNFEMVAPYPGGGLAHYYRDNDQPLMPWIGPNVFGSPLAVGAVSLIQSRFNNLELVARIGNYLAHFYRDSASGTWYGPNYFAFGVASGTPSLIQDASGNFQVITPLVTGGMALYYRDNSVSTFPWHGPIAVSTTAVDAVSLIQSSYGGNLELVARVGSQLAHFYRDSSSLNWSGPSFFASGVSGAPSLIQSRAGTPGNFEVVTPLAGGGLAHFWRDNSNPAMPWNGPDPFASGSFDGAALIQRTMATIWN